MPCYHPVKVWPALHGGRPVYSPSHSYAGAAPFHIPCNGCIGCNAARAAEWKVRLLLEARFHECASFATFTYANEHLPEDYSLSRRTVQLLNKRLRNAFGPFRFFFVGEHGDGANSTHRPHYHAIFFGLPIRDAVPMEVSQSGLPQWESAALSAAWGMGRVTLGEFSGASASYIAGYVHKKLGRRADDERYRLVHPVTGEVCQVQPEFSQMSRRPGIGMQWFRRFEDTDARSDFLISLGGRKAAMPSYFRELVDARREAVALDAFGRLPPGRLLNDFELFDILRKRDRLVEARLRVEDFTPDRLGVREEAHRLRTAGFARGNVR